MGENWELHKTLRPHNLGLFFFQSSGDGVRRSSPWAGSYFPRKFPASTFPSLGKVSENTSLSHRRNFSISHPLLPPPPRHWSFFTNYLKDVGGKEVELQTGRLKWPRD